MGRDGFAVREPLNERGGRSMRWDIREHPLGTKENPQKGQAQIQGAWSGVEVVCLPRFPLTQRCRGRKMVPAATACPGPEQDKAGLQPHMALMLSW